MGQHHIHLIQTILQIARESRLLLFDLETSELPSSETFLALGPVIPRTVSTATICPCKSASGSIGHAYNDCAYTDTEHDDAGHDDKPAPEIVRFILCLRRRQLCCSSIGPPVVLQRLCLVCTASIELGIPLSLLGICARVKSAAGTPSRLVCRICRRLSMSIKRRWRAFEGAPAFTQSARRAVTCMGSPMMVLMA